MIDPTIAVHQGRVVKRTGDGAIVEFRSVIDAVRCAIEVQSVSGDVVLRKVNARRIEIGSQVKEGETVPVNQVVATIGEAGEQPGAEATADHHLGEGDRNAAVADVVAEREQRRRLPEEPDQRRLRGEERLGGEILFNVW